MQGCRRCTCPPDPICPLVHPAFAHVHAPRARSDSCLCTSFGFRANHRLSTCSQKHLICSRQLLAAHACRVPSEGTNDARSRGPYVSREALRWRRAVMIASPGLWAMTCVWLLHEPCSRPLACLACSMRPRHTLRSNIPTSRALGRPHRRLVPSAPLSQIVNFYLYHDTIVVSGRYTFVHCSEICIGRRW